MNPTSDSRDDNPYVGPRPLEIGHEIYGRDREILDLCDVLVYKRFVLLHSPSGAGKTSLIQAGLVPALQRRRLRLVLPLIRVGTNPPQDAVTDGQALNRYRLSTCIALDSTLPEEMRTPLVTLAKLSLRAYLRRRERNLKAAGQANLDRPEVLIFDQFEEVISLDENDRPAKRQFFAELGAVLHGSGYLALFAMREDYVAGLEAYLDPLPERLGARFRIDLLGREAATLAIQEPARQRAVTISSKVARMLVDDLCQTTIQQPDGSLNKVTGSFVEPVNLQVVCKRLWSIRKSPRRIVAADLATNSATEAELVLQFETSRLKPRSLPVYAVDLALSAYYTDEVGQAAKDASVTERAIRDWFDQQVITEHGLRGQVLKSPGNSQGLDNHAIQRLVDAHLVRQEERRGLTWFELAHDRLVTPVKANNSRWYAQNLKPFQFKAIAWHNQRKPVTLLLTGRELDEAAASGVERNPLEDEYIQDSLEARRAFERERRAERGINLGETGWGIIFAADANPSIREALSELLEHRKRQATEQRTEYYSEFTGSRGYQPGDTVRQFLQRRGVPYGLASPDKLPHYLLIVGGPESIPFDFQYRLDERYSVGRIAFDTLAEYASYARSVVETENGSFALPQKLTVFSPVHEHDTASSVANESLVTPIMTQLRAAYPDWQVQYVRREDATKARLQQLLGGSQFETPALLFSATHGLGFPNGDERQARENGALVCQDWAGPGVSTPPAPAQYFSGGDVNPDARLLGLVAFLFASYSGGTPQQADSEWTNTPDARLAPRPLLAQLPSRLLGHPRGGALAVIGHVDDIYSSSFLGEGNSPEFDAIADTLDRLMRGHTVGSAMEALNHRFVTYHQLLSEELIQITFRSRQSDQRRLRQMFIRATDARNYILLGDPAARLPVEATPPSGVTARPTIQPVNLAAEVLAAPNPPAVSTPVAAATSAERVLVTGLVRGTGQVMGSLTIERVSEFVESEPRNADLERELRQSLESQSQASFSLESGIDPKDLSQAGWGVIFASDSDPAIRQALAPLLEHRRAQASRLRPNRYRELAGTTGYHSGESKRAFLANHGAPSSGPVNPDELPYYLLLVGTPDQIPFRFQKQLGVQHAVGRLDLSTLDEYRAYAQSVLQAEGVWRPQRAAFFEPLLYAGTPAPDTPPPLLQPLAEWAGSQGRWEVQQLFGPVATRNNLSALLQGSALPTVMVLAGEGLSLSESDPHQLAYQGALVCQEWSVSHVAPIPLTTCFSADDILPSFNFTGTIWVQRASFSVGTDAEQTSEWSQLVPPSEGNVVPRMFTSRLAQRLLGCPGGAPLAVLGFVGPRSTTPHSADSAAADTAPYQTLLRRLARGEPLGSALEALRSRYAELSATLSYELQNIKYGKVADPARLADLWTTTNNAGNLMVLGDPAVRLSIATYDVIAAQQTVGASALASARRADAGDARVHVDLQLRMARLPSMLYPHLARGSHRLASVLITNPSPDRSLALDVRAEIPGYSASQVELITIQPKAQVAVDFMPPLLPNPTQPLRDGATAVLDVRIAEHASGNQLQRSSLPIWLTDSALPVLAVRDPTTGEWQDFAWYLGLFINPSDPKVQNLLTAARSLHPGIGRRTPTSGEAQIEQQVSALYDVIRTQANLQVLEASEDLGTGEARIVRSLRPAGQVLKGGPTSSLEASACLCQPAGSS